MRLRNFILRRSTEFIFAVALIQLFGCGSVRVGGISNPSGVNVASGTVSFVSLTVMSNADGTFVNVTAVTLLVPMGSNSLMLCGDQRPNFVMNSNVQVSFTSGQGCSNLVKVTAG